MTRLRPATGGCYNSGVCLGAVAQLGERLLCKEDVRGSSPLSSTTRNSSRTFRSGYDGKGGIISIIPGATEPMFGVFGLSQIIWFVWLGIVLLRSNPGKTA